MYPFVVTVDLAPRRSEPRARPAPGSSGSSAVAIRATPMTARSRARKGDHMDAKKMPETIKAKRLAKKVSLAEVAKAVGKNPTYVAAALTGNHRLTPDEAKKVG